MPGLNTSMNVAVSSLMVQQAAIETTTNNIANANTDGYTRERVNLTEAPSVTEGKLTYGNGVTIQSIESVRDDLLDLRLQEESSAQGSADAQSSALQQVETLFSNTDSGVGSSINSLFTSLSSLSTDPTSVSQRNSVLTAANNLAQSFHSTVNSLNQISSSLDLAVSEGTSQVNGITQQLSKLNLAISQAQNIGQTPETLIDQRTQLTKQLSALMDIRTIQTNQGVTVTASNGTPLVVADKSYALTTAADSTGHQQIYSSDGTNITSVITGGKIGGTLSVRDDVIPQTLSQLDTLAYDFTSAMNTANQSGYDLNGAVGDNIFTPLTAVSGSAASFSVAMTDPATIAASSDGSTGSNGNVNNLIAVQKTALSTGQTANEAYSTLVFNVGNASSQAQTDSSASATAMSNLESQWSNISGVSVDEESTNLIKYQRAYQAAARVITTVDEMTQTVLSMGSGT